MSQYKAQLLSILGIMPSFPNNTIPSMFPATIMLNILGGAYKDSHKQLMQRAAAIPTANLHMYGKESKPARKIGHITVIGSSMTEASNIINPLIEIANAIRTERKLLPSQPSQKSPPPPKLVAVTMGSDSDLPVLKPGLAILDSLNISYHLTITSAHRTPALMSEFAIKAASNGVKVIIAAAGGAAHLPGMIAAQTALPVIGVPVKGSTLDGMDSLLSIVQMPRGVPVATVAINNSVNAALLAARILGTSDVATFARLEEYMKKMEDEVVEKKGRLESVGWKDY
jgi:phosphoribosylaminoimidazole carboxylase